jgi:hypothetical protein
MSVRTYQSELLLESDDDEELLSEDDELLSEDPHEELPEDDELVSSAGAEGVQLLSLPELKLSRSDSKSTAGFEGGV